MITALCIGVRRLIFRGRLGRPFFGGKRRSAEKPGTTNRPKTTVQRPKNGQTGNIGQNPWTNGLFLPVQGPILPAQGPFLPRYVDLHPLLGPPRTLGGEIWETV